MSLNTVETGAGVGLTSLDVVVDVVAGASVVTGAADGCTTVVLLMVVLLTVVFVVVVRPSVASAFGTVGVCVGTVGTVVGVGVGRLTSTIGVVGVLVGVEVGVVAGVETTGVGRFTSISMMGAAVGSFVGTVVGVLVGVVVGVAVGVLVGVEVGVDVVGVFVGVVGRFTSTLTPVFGFRSTFNSGSLEVDEETLDEGVAVGVDVGLDVVGRFTFTSNPVDGFRFAFTNGLLDGDALGEGVAVGVDVVGRFKFTFKPVFVLDDCVELGVGTGTLMLSPLANAGVHVRSETVSVAAPTERKSFLVMWQLCGKTPHPNKPISQVRKITRKTPKNVHKCPCKP